MNTVPEGQLLAMVAELCEPLHRQFERAARTSAGSRRLMRLWGPEYDWLGTHQIRALTHQALSEELPGGWTLVGNHSRNGELWLGQGFTTMRLLHTLSEEHVPPPGSNRARRAFYCNTPLLPGFDEQQQLDLIERSRLLGLWRVTNWATFEVGIRVVRTVGTWSYRARAQTDVDVLLPRVVEDFATLEWVPSDAGMELNIPANDIEEGQEGGAAD